MKPLRPKLLDYLTTLSQQRSRTATGKADGVFSGRYEVYVFCDSEFLSEPSWVDYQCSPTKLG